MILVKIKKTGDIGYIVGIFMQPIQRQLPDRMQGNKVIPGQVQQGLLLMGTVAVGSKFISAPLEDIEPIYELPEDGETSEKETEDNVQKAS